MFYFRAIKLKVINIYPQKLWINLCLSTKHISNCKFFNLLDTRSDSLLRKQLVPIHDGFQFQLLPKFYDVSF